MTTKNKAELLADLESKAIEILGTTGPNPLNGGHKEYEVNCVLEISHNVCDERIIPIRVIGEGTPEEKAYYVKAPPTNRESVLAAKLTELQAAGAVTANDLSHLGITYADLNMDGQRIFVTMLNEQTVILPGV
jgi:hypothetical protein